MPKQLVFGTVREKVTRFKKVLFSGEETEEVGFFEFDGAAPAVVGVKVGFTKNMDNWESKRVDVSLSIPANPDQESIDAAADWAEDWASRRLKISFGVDPDRAKDGKSSNGSSNGSSKVSY